MKIDFINNTYHLRAATLIVTDDPVPRDMFYNGKLKNERGAVVLRVAPSWFRSVLGIRKDLFRIQLRIFGVPDLDLDPIHVTRYLSIFGNYLKNVHPQM